MHRDLKVFKSVALTVSIFLLVAGCGKEQIEQSSVDPGETTLEIAEQEPVAGWLDVVLPSEAVAMDARGDNIWILTEQGFVMRWNSTRREWSSVETDEPLMETSRAFAISASENGAAVLTSGGLIILEDDLVTEIIFSEGTVPEGLCYVEEEVAVLFNDGSVAITDGSAAELVQIVESSEKTAVGSFSSDQNVLVWINTDGTASRFDVTESLLTDVSLPDSAVCLMMAEGQLFAQNGSSLYRLNGDDSWEPLYSGTFTGEDHLYTDMGICTLESEDLVTAGLSQTPEKTCQLDDGTIWAISTGRISVWAEIGSVETRLPEADVQMIRYRMAGQTGGGSGSGSGIGTTDMSMGGVFRIYESVSSRPDPFSEFPLTSRDLRRSLADLTIEELHLVGIVLDPTGGDQAMVEDANGVAYVLTEGTVLLNNTHIAEITGNEVIVVQEVTVGSEDAVGGTTLIPTIFSMRLHEEGGL
ncbi:MAG: hypothetical protein KAH31_10320 [Candidatus Sabulitectum sp.]|nr:hypothetical protein [Candidatus Sabulitectum sp.]